MTWEPVWEEIFQHQEWGKYPSEDLIRFVARNYYGVEKRREVKILEVGCGPGANLWFLAREGFTVFGVDGSKSAIEKARNRLNQECPGWNGDLVTGDITRLPFPDEFFDAVIDNEAIYCNCFRDSQQIFSELARVTKTKGKLYSRTFATGSWGDNTGMQVGHNAWVVAEGPLLNKGYSRFTGYEEIPDLVESFQVCQTELLTRTVDDRQHQIKEWLIIGEKI